MLKFEDGHIFLGGFTAATKIRLIRLFGGGQDVYRPILSALILHCVICCCHDDAADPLSLRLQPLSLVRPGTIDATSLLSPCRKCHCCCNKVASLRGGILLCCMYLQLSDLDTTSLTRVSRYRPLVNVLKPSIMTAHNSIK